MSELRFYGADADTIFQEIMDEMRILYPTEYGALLSGGLTRMLIHLTSRALWRVSYQANFAAADTIRGGVRTLRGASRIAKQLGYSPRGASSASTSLSVALASSYAFDVPLPAGTEFSGPNGTTWRTSEAFSWAATETAAKRVTVTEGTRRSVSFTSDGSKNQRFQIPIDRESGEYLQNAGLTVTVGGVEWEEYDTIPAEAVNAYEVFYITDPPILLFGSGGSGNVPSAGTTVEVSYIVSLGAAGNIGANQISELVTPLVVGTTEIELEISQPESAENGLPDQTITEAVNAATASWKTRDAAVTAADFEAVALAVQDARYGRAAAASATSPRGAGSDATLNILLDAARTAVGDPATAVEAADADIETATDAITEALASLSTSLSTISAANSSIITKAAESTVDHNTASTALNALTALVSQITAAAATASGLLATFSAANSQLTGTVTINGTVNVVGSGTSFNTELSVGDLISVAGEIRQVATLPGATSMTVTQAFAGSSSGNVFYLVRKTAKQSTMNSLGAEIQAMLAAASGLSAHVSTASGALSGILTDLSSIDTSADSSAAAATTAAALGIVIAARNAEITTASTAAVAATSGVLTDLEVALQGIYDHVDLIVAHDAKANIVQVAVLSRDSDGFLTAPSTGLLAAIEAEIETRKEPQVAVETLDGSSSLVVPDISVTGTYRAGKPQAEAEASVEKALRNHIKALTWGDGLYYEDIYGAIIDLPLCDKLTVEINGPAEHQDANGNLALPGNRAFTAPVISVSLTEA